MLFRKRIATGCEKCTVYGNTMRRIQEFLNIKAGG
jgi:hypothetical protein